MTARDPGDESLADAERLCRLRELREGLAQRRVARERQAAAACAQAMAQARSRELQSLQRQAEHQRSMQRPPEGGQGLSVARLQQSFEWSAALKSNVEQARAGVRQAQVKVDMQQERLSTQRQAWAAAQRGVDQAERLRQRLAAEGARLKELRLEDAVDEAATQARTRRRWPGGTA